MNKTLFTIPEAVLRQAARYGAQVALLDDHNMDEARTPIRVAYLNFRDQFDDDRTKKLITDSFWNAYETV